MSESFAQVGLCAGVIGFGVMAGVYFAFSSFVIEALAALPPATAITAMKSINAAVLSSWFMPLFVGTSVLAAVIGAWAVTDWGRPGAWAVLVGSGLYLIGMLGCTTAGNVPLNHILAATDPAGTEAAAVWSHYVERWTLLNHVRTAASALACGLFVIALVSRAWVGGR